MSHYESESEPQSKRVCTMYNTQAIHYRRMYSEDHMTLLEDVNTRINTVRNILKDLLIESTKRIWYLDLEKYYMVRDMIMNNNFDNLVIHNSF